VRAPRVIAVLVAAFGLVAATGTALAAPPGGPHTPVTICHKPGTPAEHTLVVDDDAVPAHLAHGDSLGPCAVTPPTSGPPGPPGVTPTGPGAPGAAAAPAAPGASAAPAGTAGAAGVPTAGAAAAVVGQPRTTG
jgi:hypothetical protein